MRTANEGVLPLPNSWDGRCLVGPGGRLGIALGSASLEHLRSFAQPTHWLMPLEDPALVKSSASLPGEVLWISLRHPSETLGKLNDDYRGAWVHANTLTVRLDGDLTHRGWTRVSEELWSLERVAEEVATLWMAGTGRLAAPLSVAMSENVNLTRVAA